MQNINPNQVNETDSNQTTASAEQNVPMDNVSTGGVTTEAATGGVVSGEASQTPEGVVAGTEDKDNAPEATDKKEDSKAKDEANKKLMGLDKKEKLKPSSAKRTKKQIARIEKVKKRAEDKLVDGTAVGFNKQVIRMEFYRDNFRKLVNIALVNSVVMVAIIIGMLVYMFQTVPENRYFATTVDGRIMQLIPLDEPSMTLSELYSWTVQAVSDTLTFGYHDYQRRLQESTKYFTRAGWETFTSMIQGMQLLDNVGRSKLLVKAYPTSAPELQQQGVFNGRYRWVMVADFRMEMTGKGGSNNFRDFRLRLTVERVPVLENIKGIAIKRWEVLKIR